MKGLFFVHINEDSPGQLNVRTGFVKEKVGAESYLLEFQGKDYRFCNVFTAAKLERFAFFNTLAEQQAFLEELKANTRRASEEPAPVPELTQ